MTLAPSTQPKYFSCAETAGFIRRALKEAFPGVKFGVVSRRGSSVDISWTDGPNDAQVCAVVNKFRGSYFDSGIDYKGAVYHLMDGVQVRFCADYVCTRRAYSDAAVQRAIDQFARYFAGNLQRDSIEVPTVAQWRSGALINAQLPGVHHDFSRSIHREISTRLDKNSDRMTPARSATAGRVMVSHDDGYGRSCGTGGGSSELRGLALE